MNPLMTECGHSGEKPVIVALDFPDEAALWPFVRRLDPAACRVKVGNELFTASGRKLVEALIGQGFDVFLDLKYHDIPNTVAHACKVAADMGVWMVNMHSSGGRRMMEAAVEAVAAAQHRPLLIGVTVLTSMETADLVEIGWRLGIADLVMHQAGLAHTSGLDGVVCSAHEAAALKQAFGQDFRLVTPGIRLAEGASAAADDQRRIMTPKQALAAGADYLVMGRPLVRAANPAALLADINNGLV